MATIKDVAQAAGVSPATVSRVLNGLDGYTEATATRVHRAVTTLKYRPDVVARGLKTRTSSLIGVLAPKVSDALASEIMAGVESAARQRGFTVMFGRTGRQSRLAAPYLQTLRSYHAAGVVLISALPSEEIRQAIGTRIPLVSVAITDGSSAPAIALDDRAAASDATRFLQRLGHRHIVHLAGNSDSVYVAGPREQGYRSAMAAQHLEPQVIPGDFTYESGVAAARSLLATGRPGPTAVFAASDEMAVGVVTEFQRAGLSVPESISVLGFDNTAASRHLHPQLSTVSQPLFDMGEAAVAMILDQQRLGRRIAPHTIVERASTAPPEVSHQPGPDRR